MLRARRFGWLMAAAVTLLAGCNTTDSVSKFCAASNTTLTAAAPVFADIPASCLRRKNLEQGIGSFSAITDYLECDKIGVQADGAIAAAKILADYFTAINSLATFGTADTSADALTLVSKAGAALDKGQDKAARQALNSIAAFLTSAATGRYQQRSLNRDLELVSKNIGDVTDALARILSDFYLEQLHVEDQKLSTHYLKFSQKNTAGEVTLQLDDRWHKDEQAIRARQAAAASLIDALHAIKKGSASLAASGHSLKAKELPALLDPYVTQLQTLIPQIEKAF